MTSVRNWVGDHRRASVVLFVVAVVAFVGVAGLATASITDSPDFCRSACHEMAPYNDAWAQGPHAGVSCVECHVDPGEIARLKHKFVALGEVRSHFSGDFSFPAETAAHVPDSRCITCHEQVAIDTPGFDHKAHAARGACQTCHADAGHRVSANALAAAGILADGASETTLTGQVAVADGGSANIEGHKSVSCSRCHDMKATGCAACHTPDHAKAGPAKKTAACDTCHDAGAAFAFDHPRAKSECQTCHEPPAKHRTGACSDCHKSTEKWDFDHPSRSATCTDCHDRPKKHSAGTCSTCHKTGDSWAFRHPKSTSCTSCHKRPAAHRSGACTTCHASRSSWAFSHPGTASTCTNCHNRPSGHSSGACSSCHRTGRSWSFSHTASSSCASCHKAPSSHYGSSCSSCHSPSRRWSSASFNHPRIRGGEHSYRSFACSKCHPSGYSSATCSRCHKSANGPSDD